ncbi:MAG: pimeloyl-ACP methyl ester carboxylesterase [Hyphomicrobiaceae bacterium]|jgi:pimeloyl-ACP methyl ester carboxylesterase
MHGANIVDGTTSVWIDTGEVRIHTSDWGGSGAQTIVFCHPTGFLGFVWKPIIDRLRKRGVDARIFTFDARGHGLSSKPDKGYDWQNFGIDLAFVLERLGVNEALAVGHSAGATAAALASTTAPGRLGRLLLIDPILLEITAADSQAGADDNPMAARTRTRRLVWPSRDFLKKNFASRPPYDTWTAEALDAYIDYGTFERPDGEIELLCPGRIEAQVYASRVAFNAFAMLGQVTVPVHLVAGEKSDSFGGSRLRRAREILSESPVLVVAGASHFIPMEQPDLITDLVVTELGT